MRVTTSVWFAIAAAACTSSSSSNDGTYQCVVGQRRCGGGEKWPPGFESSAASFVLTIDGDSMAVHDVVNADGTVADSFTCTGSWSGSSLECVLPTGTSCVGGPQTDVPFGIVVSGTDPNNGQPLASGQIWAGEWPLAAPTNLSALCQR